MQAQPSLGRASRSPRHPSPPSKVPTKTRKTVPRRDDGAYAGGEVRGSRGGVANRPFVVEVSLKGVYYDVPTPVVQICVLF